MATRLKRDEVMIPLLNVLKKLPSSSRVIILAHLDDKTRDKLYRTITLVLRSRKVPADRRQFLKARLAPFKKQLDVISGKKKFSSPLKKSKLLQVGGGPMKHILSTALSLLLKTFEK